MIVLDTHVWVWYVSDPTQLSSKAAEYLEIGRKNGGLYISCISAWEVALLVKKGRLRFTIDVEDWISRTERLSFFKFVPVDNTIAVKSVHLPGFSNPDPADRIIIATALHLGMPIVTKDEKLHSFKALKTIW
ncbi:MAG: VapC toxin family PIN domain ribonuclease [Deltaproteobacteria bacterium]|nr:MAG: VapC toxin family PIN domain ribonuclease [Deltaproteobacteria bacterium]